MTAGGSHGSEHAPRSGIDYRSLVEDSPSPCFETDADGRCVFVNRAWSEVTGLGYEESLDLGWMSALVPEDRVAITETRRHAIEAGADYEHTYRVARADGSVRHIHVTTRALRVGSRLMGWFGWCEDRTPHVQLRAAVAEHEALFAEVFDHSAFGLVVLDRKGRIVRANPRLCGWIGIDDESDLIGTAGPDLLIEDDRPSAWERIQQTVDGSTLQAAQRRLMGPDGAAIEMWTTLAPIFDADGFAHLVVVSFSEFSEPAAQVRDLQHLADHDALTGLPNRRALDRWLAETPATAALVVDLDRFKDVNDAFGHHVGDLALVEAAERLRKCVRQSDLLCRLGGDEFLVLLQDADSGSARATQDRIQQSLARPATVEGHVVDLGATVGVAEGDATALELATRADEDLLAKKANNTDVSVRRA